MGSSKRLLSCSVAPTLESRGVEGISGLADRATMEHMLVQVMYGEIDISWSSQGKG